MSGGGGVGLGTFINDKPVTSNDDRTQIARAYLIKFPQHLNASRAPHGPEDFVVEEVYMQDGEEEFEVWELGS